MGISKLLADAEKRVAAGDIPEVVRRLHHPYINADGKFTGCLIDHLTAAYEAGWRSNIFEAAEAWNTRAESQEGG